MKVGGVFPSWSLAWQDCATAFLQSIHDLSGSAASRETYRSTLQRFFLLCNVCPDQVTRSAVISFMHSPSTSKRNLGGEASASTKCQRLCVLRSFYTFASTWQVGSELLFQKANPTIGLTYPKRAVHPHALTASEFERLIAAIPTDTVKGLRDRALFLLYFWLGRRRSEILRLCFRDIEVATIVESDGTRRQGHIYRYTSKGKSQQVKARELPAPAWNALSAYLEASGRASMPDEPLFASTYAGHQGEPLNHHWVNQMFKQYCALAGIDSTRFSLHSLRHTAAHERYMAGEDILSIKEFLDHSGLQTTYMYLQSLSGVSDNGAKLLEKRFSHLSKP